MGITKNRQSEENIYEMARTAFKRDEKPAIKELTEGLCNAAYELTYEDGFSTILKISSPVKKGYLTNEINLMEAEIRAMELVYANTDIRVAKVYKYDTSRKLCSGDYFFMEKLDGVSLMSLNDGMDKETYAGLSREVGKVQKKLSGIRGEKFGMLGDDLHRFDNLFDYVYYLINNVLTDAEKKDVVTGVPKPCILDALLADKKLFDKVKEPVLIHWDMWDGNIFVKDGHIAGIIDWERAMWAEPFMDDRFRSHNRNDGFLEGFGISCLSDEEMRRIYWYDIFLYLTMMTEVTYREYEDDGQYSWVKPMFDKAWELIQKERE